MRKWIIALFLIASTSYGSNITNEVEAFGDNYLAPVSAFGDYWVYDKPTSGPTWDVSTNQVLHWRFNDDAATTVVIDSSGEGYTGIISGANSEDMSVAGKINSAFKFDGTNDVASVIDVPVADVPMTLMCWYKPSSVSGLQRLVTIQTAVTIANTISIAADSAKAMAQHYNAPQNGIASASSTVSTGEWVHIAGVFTSSTSRDLYVDSVLVASNSIAVDAFTSLSLTTVGYLDLSGENQWCSGTIDDVRILDRAATQEEIEGIYNDGNGTEADSN